MLAGCVSIQIGAGRQEPFVETVVHGESGPKILLVDIEGIIRSEPEEPTLLQPQREGMLARLNEELDRARQDDEIRALLLRIDSPGGEVTASDVAYDQIMRFKRERKIPVVAEIMGMGTSGAYYVAMAADVVMAHPTSVTGSIGVIFLGVNVVGLMQKLGIEDQTITAGAHKDAGSPLRRMTPTERAHFQSVLGDLHSRFKHVVAKSRTRLDAAQVDALADGSIYSASQALANGLIDGIGDLDAAIALTEKRAGLERSRVIRYHRPQEWKQNLYSRPVLPERVKLELPLPLALPPTSGFYYLWTAAASGG